MEKKMTPEQEFKDNLCRLTGDGSLVKLDMADETAMSKRLLLLTETGYPIGNWGSAVFIYICNVLDQMGVGKDYAEHKKLIKYSAMALVDCSTLHNTGGVPEGALDKKLQEVFHYAPYLDAEQGPTLEVIQAITGDFERIKNVWHNKYVLGN